MHLSYVGSLLVFPLKGPSSSKNRFSYEEEEGETENINMSDEDIFSSQPDVRPSTDVPVFVSKTQPQKSDVEYMWNVVFHWDLGNKTPFSLQPIANFCDSEVPDTWYIFKLRDDLRKKKIYVKMLNGKYSIFAKVEKGKKNLNYFPFSFKIMFVSDDELSTRKSVQKNCFFFLYFMIVT